MASNSNKRQRQEADPWWEKAVSWIQNNDGFIHDAISVTTDTRELVVQKDIPKDTILMKIPLTCLPYHDTIRSTTLGEKLSNCIASLSDKLYSNQQDLLIALVLGHQTEHGGIYQPYLESLPPSSAFNLLPRKWSTEKKVLLSGSSFLERVEKACKGIAQDYELISGATSDDSSLCSFESFDTMMAVVSSRAFAGMSCSGNDQDIAMVPLLDMCNHQRGKTNYGKNVSYQRGKSAVQATAYETISAGTTLRITYGAKGNGQLLLNYGFAIYNNMEPDGSSNDVVETQLGGRIVELRTGPKSYTFGCFSRAVEKFHEQDANAIECDGPGDLEDFLNECNENPGMCGMIDDDEEEEEEEEEDANKVESSIKAEIAAIQRMQEALISARNSYTLAGMPLKHATSGEHPVERYAAILVHSEVRTISFYEIACRRIIEKLTKSEEQGAPWKVVLDEDDQALLERQAQELADAFVRIRFPS